VVPIIYVGIHVRIIFQQAGVDNNDIHFFAEETASNSSLSSSSRTGIIAGSIIGFVALIAILLFVVRQRRDQRGNAIQDIPKVHLYVRLYIFSRKYGCCLAMSLQHFFFKTFAFSCFSLLI